MNMTNLLKALFKRKHPVGAVAYIGRKNFEKSMDCKVMKRKKLEKLAAEDSQSLR